MPRLLLTLSCACWIACSTSEGPSVQIEVPADGSAYPQGARLELLGQVGHPGGLDHVQSVTWTSDLDGALQDLDIDDLGRVSVRASLSVGGHTLRLEAIDDRGQSAFDEVVVSMAGFPTARILTPPDGAQFIAGIDLPLEGRVSDPDQTADTIQATWSWRELDDAVPTPLQGDEPTADGATSAKWNDVPEGSFLVSLTAIDDDGNEAVATIAVSAIPGTVEDADEDGYSSAEGDCNDDDPAVHPAAAEVCNQIDDDCNVLIDDKDLDGDLRIDSSCFAYVGTSPRNDCDDDNPAVHGDHPEVEDGIDNDCDGERDEGFPVYDHDGDCYCEAEDFCVDGIDDDCDVLTPGDCLGDDDPNIHPGAPDPVEAAEPFIDGNCDGMDGDASLGLFVAEGGASAGDCTREEPCNWARARAVLTDARPALYLRGGTYVGTITTVDGLELHGGYGPDYSVRYDHSSDEEVTRIQGTSAPGNAPIDYATLYAFSTDGVVVTNLVLAAPDAQGNLPSGRGGSTYVVHAVQSELTLANTRLERGIAANGLNGSSGAHFDGPAAPDGDEGGDACQGTPCANTGGSFAGQLCANYGGVAAGGPRGGTGGNGGLPGGNGIVGDDALRISGSAGTGGARGTGATSLATCPGTTPGMGRNGFATNGSGGSAGGGGTFASHDWAGDRGGTGDLGLHGGGGGGGGGAGGCSYTIGQNEIRWTGGGGGGGGSGGCRNINPGTGGHAGGAAVGIYAYDTTLSLDDVEIAGGQGGRGGDGGNGGAGQAGGTGGDGGAAGGLTKAGGRGGDGAHGGHAGGGGGGEGGPVLGIVLLGGAQATMDSPVTWTAGTPGSGGGGGDAAHGTSFTDGNDGAPGANGTEIQIVQP